MSTAAISTVAAELLDPLELAGRRLEAAAAELDRLCRPPAPLPDEEVFGLAESAFLAARETFRRMLAERLGRDSESIARRLAL